MSDVGSQAGPSPESKTKAVPISVIRFAELMPDWSPSPDARLDGNHRAVYRYIGGPPDRNSLAAAPGGQFCNGVVMAPPQNGAPLHDHHCEEIFMVWQGRFEVYWEDRKTREEKSVVLGLYDAIRFPAGIMRGYRNIGDREGFLYYIHGMGEYRPPVFHETVRAGLTEDLPGEPYVREPAYDPATQVVRYDECPMNWNVYHETRLPEGVRGIRRYIGEMGGEREGEGPPPSLPEGEVCLVINENRVGSGAPLHDHLDLEEMFIPVEGRWGMYWLDERGDRRQTVLEPWDACWVPPGVQRGFWNAGRDWGKLHVVHGLGGAVPPDYAADYSALRG